MTRTCLATVGMLCGFAYLTLSAGVAETANDYAVTRERVISLPSRPTEGEQWREQCRVACEGVYLVAQDALALVADESLTTTERVQALTVASYINPMFTEDALIKVIDLVDDRGFISGGFYFGRYPVVGVLVQYGSAIVDTVAFALSQETQPHRRALFCDVLDQVLGLDDAIREMREYPERHELSEDEQRNVIYAIDELESRVTSAN